MSESKQVRLAAVSSAKGVMPSLQQISMLVVQLACDIMDTELKIIIKSYAYQLISKEEDGVTLSNPLAIVRRI
jgi:hypothetical protein